MTEANRPDAHPDAEQLAELIEGRLRGEERARVVAHLADCDECRSVFASAARHDAVVLPFWKRPKVQAVGGGVLALAASLILVVQVRPDLNPFHRRTSYEQLIAAVGANRRVEGRLTAFHYGDLRSPSRSGETDAFEDYEVLAAAARVRALASEHPTEENVRAFGVAQLALGRYDDAIRILERGADGKCSGRCSSDLAAAYLERGRIQGNAEDYAKALAAAERAIRDEPSLVEPYFNRALALEHLHLRELASSAWDEAIRRDPSSGWATEARRRKAGDNQSSKISGDEFVRAARAGTWQTIDSVLSGDAQFPREMVEDRLLPEWGAAILAGRDSDAKDACAALTELTQRAVARFPDLLFASTVALVSSPLVPASREALARGHVEYGRGRAALELNHDQEAAHRFASASQQLQKAGSPFHLWADFYVALTAYYNRDIERSRALAIALERVAVDRQYGVLFGRVQWLRGLLAITAGRYDEARNHYDRALSAFDRHSDGEHRAAVGYLLAEVHMNLGDRRAAWHELERALAARSSIHDAWRRHTLLLMAALVASRTGFFDAAMAFQQVLVDQANTRGNPVAQTEAYLQRAVTFAHRGAASEADRDIHAAYGVSRTVADTDVRRSLEIDVMLADGEVRLARGDAEAVRPLNTALPQLRDQQFTSRLVRLLLARGKANLLGGKEAAAEADLDEGIALADRLRSRLSGTTSRLRYTDRIWDLYEQMAALRLRQHKYTVAHELVDRARGRHLAEALQPRLPREHRLTIDRVQRQMGSDTALLSYILVDSVVGVWITTAAAHQWVELPVSSAQLRTEVETYVDTLTARDDARSRRLGTILFDRLIAPVQRHIGGTRRLIVIPHDALCNLPFSTLFDRARQEYLVESRSVVIVPSLVVLGALKQRLLHSQTSRSVLAVGDPAMSRRENLPRLPRAADEARDVGRLYVRAEVITGAAATRAALVQHLRSFDVLHFAGHAVASREVPDLSRIVLAPARDGVDGDVYVHDLWKLRLRSLQLVVLSACRTADGPLVRGEGAVTLSSAFLGAGVPRVIGTLWDIPDDVSAELSLTFHREFAAGVEHDVALQHAQIAFLRDHRESVRSPSVWGAFQSFGVTAS